MSREYEIVSIWDCRFSCETNDTWQMMYLVKWKHTKEPSWQPRCNLLPHSAVTLYAFEVLASSGEIEVLSFVNPYKEVIEID
jgi:hypothetical protein